MPILNMSELPGLPPDDTGDYSEMLIALYQLPETREEMAKWNSIPLFPNCFSPYELVGKKRVASVDDLKGLRVRGVRPKAIPLEKFGAVLVMVPGPEAYGALDRGMVDVVNFCVESFGRLHFDDMATHVTLGLGLGGLSHTVCCTKDAWDALPADIQETMKQVIADYPRKWSATKYVGVEDAYIARFKDGGVEVITFPAEERAKLESVADEVHEEWITGMEEKGIPGQRLYDWLLAKKAEIEGK